MTGIGSGSTLPAKMQTITEREVGQIPVQCMTGEVFRPAGRFIKGVWLDSPYNVTCMRKPALPSQGEGLCPDPNCPMAKFPSGTKVELESSIYIAELG